MIKIFTTAILSLPLFLTEMSAQQYCIEGRFDTYVFDLSEIEVFQDIQYGEAINVDGYTEQLKLDIYKASDESDELEKKPLIILVHGGSLLGGDKGLPGSVYLANDFAQKGYVFSAIN
ncbi:MAG: hypothetical protein H7X71_00610, partial [Chitinophagales bacterium]|nr:hypothetical protein [Chitinophagales bacterium]